MDGFNRCRWSYSLFVKIEGLKLSRPASTACKMHFYHALVRLRIALRALALVVLAAKAPYSYYEVLRVGTIPYSYIRLTANSGCLDYALAAKKTERNSEPVMVFFGGLARRYARYCLPLSLAGHVPISSAIRFSMHLLGPN